MHDIIIIYFESIRLVFSDLVAYVLMWYRCALHIILAIYGHAYSKYLKITVIRVKNL